MRIVFFLLFSSALMFASPVVQSVIEQQIINLTYNEEFDSAKKLCAEQIKNNPNSPKFYYYMINVKIMEYYLRVALLDEATRDEGRKRLNKEIIDYCEEVVDKFEDSNLNTENKFYFATIYGSLARVLGVDGSWWGAFRNGIKARRLAEEILQRDPKFYDAYLITGMLNYYADRMSGITSFIAGALGFSGDREKGLSQLKTAYEKGTFAFGQSAQTLIEVYANLEDNKYAAFPIYENFLDRYPRNKRTLNTYCLELLGVWELNKVEAIIKNDKQNSVENYVKARFYEAKGNSQLAIKYGEMALSGKSILRGALSNSRYIVVFNSWLVGDENKVNKYESLLNERSKESFAAIKKNEKENRWLYDLRVKLISGIKESELENILKTKPRFKTIKELEDQYNLLLGQYYFFNGMNDKAETWFLKSLHTSNEREKYTVIKFLTDIYLKQNSSAAKVKNLLAVVDDFDNDRLKFRAEDLEKKYNL